MDDHFVLEIPNDIRLIERAVEFVVGRCPTCEAHARRFHFNFRVALCEALSNAMLYGNGPDPRKRVQVHVSVSEIRVVARVTDQGNGFDPCAVADPTTPENLLQPGGRGLFLMRELLDEVHYNDQGNAVTLVLHLHESQGLNEAATA